MVAQCVSPIQARVARLIKLDVCGNPVTGASSAVVVTNGFVSIEPSPQYLDGEEHQQRRADGSLCVYQKDPSELTRVDLTTNFCVLDPDALVIITGERLLTTGSATGTGVAYGEGQLTARYSLEVWQPVTGSNACDASGNQQYVYWAFMNTGNAKVGDFTFENAPFQFTTTSETKAVGPLWLSLSGAATWLGSNTVETGEHFLHNITTAAPPTASCGAVLLS
ncbi:MAG TPA: hypothetical protein VFP47_14320 [Pyrinomonadaceae bacterium]|nr:hypothetical protein [Pyrinomonadaceae bacterium]